MVFRLKPQAAVGRMMEKRPTKTGGVAGFCGSRREGFRRRVVPAMTLIEEESSRATASILRGGG
jgi:hypothetical protein